MAKTASNVTETTNSEAWETIAEPYGDTWNFDQNPVLVGIFTSARQVELPDMNDPSQTRTVNVYEITKADDGEKYTVWGTYVLDDTFSKIKLDSQVRIEYMGKAEIGGGQTVRKFKVQTKA